MSTNVDSYEIPSFYLGVLEANADYSVEATYQFTPVTVIPSTGVGVQLAAAVAPVAATGDAAIGILQNNPQLAEAATVMVHGVSKALIKQTVVVGDKLMAAPSGGLQKWVSGSGYNIARALNAGVAGDIIPVLLLRDGLN